MSRQYPLISLEHPLLLASASPRRKRLLEQIGIPFRAEPSGAEENPPTGGPEEATRRLAEIKAAIVFRAAPPAWILGADTVVVIGKMILGKPRGEEEARHMLGMLSGETHRVTTGFALLNPAGKVVHSEAVTTFVRFKVLEASEINAYVATGEPFGKAGSYAIQGIGGFMVEELHGSYTNVVGLPLCALIKALLSAGALEGFPMPLGRRVNP